MAPARRRRRKKLSFPLALLILAAVSGLFGLLLFSDQFRSYLRTQIFVGGGDEFIGPPATSTPLSNSQSCFQEGEGKNNYGEPYKWDAWYSEAKDPATGMVTQIPTATFKAPINWKTNECVQGKAAYSVRILNKQGINPFYYTSDPKNTRRNVMVQNVLGAVESCGLAELEKQGLEHEWMCVPGGTLPTGTIDMEDLPDAISNNLTCHNAECEATTANCYTRTKPSQPMAELTVTDTKEYSTTRGALCFCEPSCIPTHANKCEAANKPYGSSKESSLLHTTKEGAISSALFYAAKRAECPKACPWTPSDTGSIICARITTSGNDGTGWTAIADGCRVTCEETKKSYLLHVNCSETTEGGLNVVTIELRDESLNLVAFHGTVSVRLRTSDSTAKATSDKTTSDYSAYDGRVTLSGGSATVTIGTVDDKSFEGAEAYKLTLSDPSGAVLGNATADCRINDNDTAAPAPPPPPATTKPTVTASVSPFPVATAAPTRTFWFSWSALRTFLFGSGR